MTKSSQTSASHRITPKLRFVVLDCIRRTWEDPTVRHLFEKTITLKFQAYGALYADALVPVDKSDFYGTHALVCSEVGQQLLPLVAMKLVSISRAKEFDEPFPFLSILEHGKSAALARCQSEVSRAQEEQGDVVYCGSWALHPSARSNTELTKTLREMIVAFMIHEIARRREKKWFCFGTPAAKTDRFFEAMGLNRISEEFSLPTMQAVAFMAETYSPDALEMAERHRPVFQSRLILAPNQPGSNRAA